MPGKTPLLRLAVVTLLTGVAAGVGGMGLALTLHLVQHLAYGYSLDAIIGNETFLQGVTGASPLRRVLALTGCGLLAGVGWWALYRWGRPLVAIRNAVDKPDQPMPLPETAVHALLQVVTVGLGSPLGREVAPREIGAALAGWLSRRAGLTADEARTLIACGAGAGLAAVYNVPLAGALFVLEVLLGTLRLSAVLPAIVTSAMAARIARLALGDAFSAVSGAAIRGKRLAARLVGAGGPGLRPRRLRLYPPRHGDDEESTPRRAPHSLGAGGVRRHRPAGDARCSATARADPAQPRRRSAPRPRRRPGWLCASSSLWAALRAGARGGMMTPGMTIGVAGDGHCRSVGGDVAGERRRPSPPGRRRRLPGLVDEDAADRHRPDPGVHPRPPGRAVPRHLA
ncbi:MAG: chloride channel protein [Rhodospirillales bacterium]